MHNALTYGLLIIALFVYIFACKVLADDAREGAYTTMGGEMYFGQLWNVATILATAGIVRLFALKIWLAIPIVIVLFFLGTPVRRTIRFLFLGLDLGKENGEQTDSSQDKP